MQKARGFTLIELMVVVALAAILMAIGIPSFMRIIKTNSMSTGVNAFMGDLRYARSESVRRGGKVVMCRSDDPESATPVCTAAGSTTRGWANGWLIFHDLDGNGDWSAGDTTLRVQSPLTSIDAILEGTSTAATKFKFTATGRLSDVGSSAKLVFGGSNFTSELQRVVCVSAGGRARISGDGAATCGTSNE